MHPARSPAVIFDLDGTLIDSAAGIEISATISWNSLFPSRPIPNIRSLIGPPIDTIFKLLEPSLDAQSLQTLVRSYRHHYDEIGWQHCALNPGISELLAIVRESGLACHLVTNKPIVPTRKILNHLRITGYFQSICSPDSNPPGKHTKLQILMLLAELENIDKTASCYVGDTIDDALTAREAGLHFIGYSGGYGKFPSVRAEYPILKSFNNDLAWEMIQSITGIRRTPPS